MYRAMLTFRWGISSAENSSYDADLNVKWRSWFEGPDGSAYYFNQDLIRYDFGDGCGVLCLCENPVVEPGLDPQTLPRHLTKHLLNLSKTPSNGNFMSHLSKETQSHSSLSRKDPYFQKKDIFVILKGLFRNHQLLFVEEAISWSHKGHV